MSVRSVISGRNMKKKFFFLFNFSFVPSLKSWANFLSKFSIKFGERERERVFDILPVAFFINTSL